MSTNNGTYTWSLTAHEQHGRLILRWGSNAPFRPQQGRIHVYNGRFPSNPTDDTANWCWDDQHGGLWNTGLPWGTGWHCAYIAERSPHSNHYIVQVITSKEMGPDVKKSVVEHQH